jgi:hypothetical protein
MQMRGDVSFVWRQRRRLALIDWGVHIHGRTKSLSALNEKSLQIKREITTLLIIVSGKTVIAILIPWQGKSRGRFFCWISQTVPVPKHGSSDRRAPPLTAARATLRGCYRPAPIRCRARGGNADSASAPL